MTTILTTPNILTASATEIILAALGLNTFLTMWRWNKMNPLYMLDTNIISATTFNEMLFGVQKMAEGKRRIIFFQNLLTTSRLTIQSYSTTTTRQGFKQTSATAWKKKAPLLTSKTHRLPPSQSQTTWSL